MKSQDFTGKYALTLHTDPHTEENYIKLPVADLAELGYMQQAILEILLASYPQEELEGISEWLKQ